MNGRRRFDRAAAWFLVSLGAFLLLTGILGMFNAVRDEEWDRVLFTAAFMVLFGLGAYRGMQQLRRLRTIDQPQP
jgi:hypothetical protein